MPSPRASTGPACPGTGRPASRTAPCSAWAPRSATPPRSSTPAGRSGCASSPPTSTWSRARARSASRAGLRVGILGGAFNPPHIGHMVCAQEALVQLELDRGVFMPVGVAPPREIEQDPGAEARLEMAELAVSDDERFEVSRMEVDKEAPAYTSET